MAKVRGKKARGFFDYEFRKDEIKNQQTSLEKLNTLINWEKFRSTTEIPDLQYNKMISPIF